MCDAYYPEFDEGMMAGAFRATQREARGPLPERALSAGDAAAHRARCEAAGVRFTGQDATEGRASR
jgi:hypothetical protein